MNMPTEPENRELFERWAESYDRDATASTEFPLAGYDRVLEEVVSQAEVRTDMSVLDLGTGTGNLAGLFLARSCAVWATDFSPRMIAQARTKYPGIGLAVASLQDSPPSDFPRRYDRVVSAYALHHLNQNAKVELIQSLAADRLLPKGRLVIADVSFSTITDRLAARSRFDDLWDPSEHYWAADETTSTLQGLDLKVTYTQVSFCAGIFVIKCTDGPGSDGSEVDVADGPSNRR